MASHHPVLLDEGGDGLAVFTHVGRPDEKLHGFSRREILDEETNLRTFARLVRHFERRVANPMFLDLEWAPRWRKAPLASGCRLRVPSARSR